MWIVALHAVSGGERLALVRFDECCVFGIVAVKAQGRRGFGQVIVELHLALIAALVDDVARIASHVERSVAAARAGNVQSLLVTSEAEVLVRAAGSRLQQLVLVGCGVRIVALKAIPNCRRMDRTFDVSGVLVGVACETERVRRRGDQLYASDVFRHPDFVATGAAHGDGRMDCFPPSLVFVTLDALGRICIFFQWYWMGGWADEAGAKNQTQSQNHPNYSQDDLHPLLWLPMHVAYRNLADVAQIGC